MTQQMSAIGRIATDPKLFTPSGGAPFCTFRLACTERRFDPQRNEWIDGDTNWFTVNAFRSLAEHAQLSFAKGDRVLVSGKLRVRSWESEERRGISVEIDADGLGHDVRFGISSFAKHPASLAAAATSRAGEKPGEQTGHESGGEPDEESAEIAAGTAPMPAAQAPFSDRTAEYRRAVEEARTELSA